MQIHHLNCGTMNPLGGKLVNRSPSRIVCHCLLVETNDGLILVDSGIGMKDIVNPVRLGLMNYLLNIRRNPADTAISQIQKLGYDAWDVKHIILTHMDLDHTGGLPDFPEAFVHVYGPEYRSATKRRSIKEINRYRKAHYVHSPKWVVHETLSEKLWFGLECIEDSKNLPSDIVMIPLIGHSSGHCAVAVRTKDNPESDKWIVHGGDIYYYDKQMDENPVCTPALGFFQFIAHRDHKLALKNYKRLRRVVHSNRDKISVFCSHDPSEFEKFSLTKEG